MHTLLDVHHLLSTYGYIGIFLIVFIESGIFFFLPGDSLLFTAGLLAATGNMRLSLILLPAIVAAFLGNLIGYWIGNHVERLRAFSFFRRLLKEEYIMRAQAFFDERGRYTVLMSRFVPAVRTFTPWVAGLGRMERHTFVAWSAISAVVWVGLLTLAGYFLGRIFPSLEQYLTFIILGIVFVSMLPIVFEWLKNRSKKGGE